MCHFQSHARQQNAISLISKIETSIDLAPSSAAVFGPLVDRPRKVETRCSRQSGFQHRVPYLKRTAFGYRQAVVS